MRTRTPILAASAASVLLLAGCSSTAQPAAQGAGAASVAAQGSSASPSTAAPSSASPSAADSPTCDMAKEPDVIVRYTVPGLQDSAQVLGGWDPTTCKLSIDKIMTGAPVGDGYCTEIAYASANPGYNADATPAGPLKKVIEAVGGSC